MARGSRRLQVAIKVLNLLSWEGSNVGFPWLYGREWKVPGMSGSYVSLALRATINSWLSKIGNLEWIVGEVMVWQWCCFGGIFVIVVCSVVDRNSWGPERNVSYRRWLELHCSLFCLLEWERTTSQARGDLLPCWLPQWPTCGRGLLLCLLADRRIRMAQLAMRFER